MRLKNLAFMTAAVLLLADVAAAQNRPSSPRGEAAAQVGGQYEGRQHTGKWVVVDYGRPILRGRTDIFGSGDTYGQAVNSGAPVWRAGANQSTRLHTEATLVFGEQTVEPGEYSLFVELGGEDDWTLIVSSHEAKDNYRDEGDGLWGAFGYSVDFDVARVPMVVHKAPHSADQFTIMFADVTSEGGTLIMWWEDTMAMAPFTVGG